MNVLLLCILFTIFQCISGQVLHQIGRLYIPNAGVPGAENAAVDYDTNRIFVADGSDTSVNSFNFSINENVTEAIIEQSVKILIEPAFEDLGFDPVDIQDITCVSKSHKGYILATVVPMNHSITFGWIAFINPTDQAVFHMMELEDCYLPDHVSTTPDGDIILISCEAEPSNNEVRYPAVNPRGSVGYIDVSNSDMTEWEYTNIGFTEFDDGQSKSSQLPSDVYIPLPDNITDGRFSIAAEPEYAVADSDGNYAYISLQVRGSFTYISIIKPLPNKHLNVQENNAIAVLDIDDKEIIKVFSLGMADFGSNGGLDASDKDDMINIVEYANVYGMRQPDSIDFYEMPNGRKFLFTANEGDSKDWDEIRVEDMDLDKEVFGNTSMLQERECLGRLKATNLVGWNETEYDGNDTVYDKVVTFSSRDFTIFEIMEDADGVPINLSLHFSNGNDFENITAEMVPEGFNSDYFTGSFDERSDAKGPEPEGINSIYIATEKSVNCQSASHSSARNLAFCICCLLAQL